MYVYRTHVAIKHRLISIISSELRYRKLPATSMSSPFVSTDHVNAFVGVAWIAPALIKVRLIVVHREREI